MPLKLGTCIVGAVIAQWIRLHLPSCGPRFDPRAQHLRFVDLYLNCDEKRKKLNKKRLELCHLEKQGTSRRYCVSHYVKILSCKN